MSGYVESPQEEWLVIPVGRLCMAHSNERSKSRCMERIVKYELHVVPSRHAGEIGKLKMEQNDDRRYTLFFKGQLPILPCRHGDGDMRRRNQVVSVVFSSTLIGDSRHTAARSHCASQGFYSAGVIDKAGISAYCHVWCVFSQ